MQGAIDKANGGSFIVSTRESPLTEARRANPMLFVIIRMIAILLGLSVDHSDLA
jgi:hypothetical protein